jgi:hypothetical protein
METQEFIGRSHLDTRTLTRLRGFALENGNSTIFWTAKYLIFKERRRPFWPKTAVVKTYPIPKRG